VTVAARVEMKNSKRVTKVGAGVVFSDAESPNRQPPQLPGRCEESNIEEKRRERMLQASIGQEVRACRMRHDMTVMELAAAAEISTGMLSKIENGIISPSLNTLQSLSLALGLPLTSFFHRYDRKSSAILMKAEKNLKMKRRNIRANDKFSLLGFSGSAASGVVVKPSLVTLTDTRDEFPVPCHDGMELIYMLEGELTYEHGLDRYHLEIGDCLFFDGETPHGLANVNKLPVRFLSVICYRLGLKINR